MNEDNYATFFNMLLAPSLNAPTSNWRKSPFSRLNRYLTIDRFENSTVETLSTKLESSWTTGLTQVAKSPFVIVSSGGVKNGFYVVKNTAESNLNIVKGERGSLIVFWT